MGGIDPQEFAARRRRTQRLLVERDYDAALVVGRSFYDRCGDLAYLTNHFPPFPTCVFDGGMQGLGHAILLLPADGEPTLLVDGRAWREDLVDIADVRNDYNVAANAVAALRDRRLDESSVALVGSDILPVALYQSVTAALPKLRLEPLDDLLVDMRLRKSEAEIALLRSAAEVAGAGLRASLEAVRPGARETDVCAAGMQAAYSAGADFVRYLRVHSGPWSAWGSRWPQASDREIQPGDLVTLDIIGAKAGYQFDVLRTTVAGDPTAEQRRLCQAVGDALRIAIDALRPGVRAGDVAQAAHAHLCQAGYPDHASRFVGHAIGLETCEIPYLLPDVDRTIPEAAVLCVEPGVFIPDFGGASFEHEVVVRADGAELLTNDPPGRLIPRPV